MKKFILTAIAASMVASPMVASEASAQDYPHQQQRHETVVRHQPGRTVVVDRTVSRYDRAEYRNDWRRGERFDYRRARNYRVINDYRGYRLKAPPRGYHYVRSGNDAVLVGITSGVIAGIIAGAIR
ncbi:RcnB family protein [Sphingomonas oligophenolica]